MTQIPACILWLLISPNFTTDHQSRWLPIASFASCDAAAREASSNSLDDKTGKLGLWVVKPSTWLPPKEPTP